MVWRKFKLIIFDEKKHAENLLLDIPKNISYANMLILAKYFRWEESCSTHACRKRMLEVYNESYKSFSEVIFKKQIDRILKQSKKQTLRKIENIPITKMELEAIHSVGNIELEKVLFAFLFIGKNTNLNSVVIDKKKSDNIYFYNSVPWNQVKRLSKSKVERKELKPIVSEGRLLQYIPSSGFKILFYEPDGEVEFEVKNPENLFNYYLGWLGEKMLECEICSKLVKPRSNRQKMCKECAYEKQLELTKNYKKRIVLENPL